MFAVLPLFDSDCLQELVRAVLQEQTETTRIGLKFLQVGANKTALEALLEEKDTAYKNAAKQFDECS
jgi:structural maintenance of chromosomes protein 5